MSDEPSDAQNLIAEVAAPLLYSHRVIGKNCTCGENVTPPSDSWYARHMGEVLAVEVDKALGGLTVEWAPCRDHCGIGTIYEQSMIHPTRASAEKRCRQAYTNPSAWDIRRRFISSGWTVTE